MLLRRALAAGLVLAALAIWSPRLADAHALVLESSPRADEVLRAAPARIFLRFNSRIEQELSGITATGHGPRPDESLGAAPARTFLPFNSRLEHALPRIPWPGPGGLYGVAGGRLLDAAV